MTGLPRGWMGAAAVYPVAVAGVILAALVTGASVSAEGAAIAPQRSNPHLISQANCSREIEPLMTQLMLDLPSYSNRVIQRASKLGDPAPLYLVVAGKMEVEPIAPNEFSNPSYSSRLPQTADRSFSPSAEEIYQITFTTLERQYSHPRRRPHPSSAGPVSQLINQQQNHWLILARNAQASNSPWRIISLRSQLTPYPAENKLRVPPHNARPGPVGQGIAIWLRDHQSQRQSETCFPSQS